MAQIRFAVLYLKAASSRDVQHVTYLTLQQNVFCFLVFKQKETKNLPCYVSVLFSSVAHRLSPPPYKMVRNRFNAKNTQMCSVYIGGGELDSVTDTVDSKRKSFFFCATQTGGGQTSGGFQKPTSCRLKRRLLKVCHCVSARMTSVTSFHGK